MTKRLFLEKEEDLRLKTEVQILEGEEVEELLLLMEMQIWEELEDLELSFSRYLQQTQPPLLERLPTTPQQHLDIRLTSSRQLLALAL